MSELNRLSIEDAIIDISSIEKIGNRIITGGTRNHATQERIFDSWSADCLDKRFFLDIFLVTNEKQRNVLLYPQDHSWRMEFSGTSFLKPNKSGGYENKITLMVTSNLAKFDGIEHDYEKDMCIFNLSGWIC